MKITELEAINSAIESCEVSVSRDGILIMISGNAELGRLGATVGCKVDEGGNVSVDDIMEAKLLCAKASLRSRQATD